MNTIYDLISPIMNKNYSIYHIRCVHNILKIIADSFHFYYNTRPSEFLRINLHKLLLFYFCPTMAYFTFIALNTLTVEIKSEVRTWGLYFYYKDRFLLSIHKYYCKYVVIHTYLSHYILCISFGSLLSTIVHLLPQINVRKNMRTALFCVVCALPVFIE